MNRQSEIADFLGSSNSGDPDLTTSEVFPLVGRDTLAKCLGLTTRAVNELVTNGVAVKIGRGEYDLIASVQNYLGKMRKPDSNAKDRLTTAQAQLAELKLSEARQELVPASQIETEWAFVVRDTTAAILGVTSKVQSQLGHLSNHDAAVIDSEIRSALTSLGGTDA